MRNAVTGHAPEFEVVDVGRPVVLPLMRMVSLAPVDRSGALDTAAVAGDEGDPLLATGESCAAAEPQRASVAVEHVADDLGERPELVEHLVGHRAAVDQEHEALDDLGHVDTDGRCCVRGRARAFGVGLECDLQPGCVGCCGASGSQGC